MEGRGLTNLTYPYKGVGGVKNCQNHPYVNNEWALREYIWVGRINRLVSQMEARRAGDPRSNPVIYVPL